MGKRFSVISKNIDKGKKQKFCIKYNQMCAGQSHPDTRGDFGQSSTKKIEKSTN